MPYIVIKANGQEIDRRELDGPIVIGCAPDCDVTLRDILLSRRHCRLEPDGDGWKLHDLQSKNGTIINAERLQGPWTLQDNDVVRLGRAKIIFHAGLPNEDIADRMMTPARPADPGDSLAGTLSGFTLLLPGEGENPENMPCPQPRPKDPPAYDNEELQTLLSAIASSSWDSVYAEARQPMRRVERAPSDEEATTRRRVRPRSPMDFSLQANPAVSESSPAEPAPELPQAEELPERATIAIILPKLRKNLKFRPNLHMTVAALWIVALVMLNIDRKPMPKPALGDQPTPISALTPKITPMDDPAASMGEAADYQKTADDDSQDSREIAPASQKAPILARKIPLNGPTARLAAEDGAFYFPLIAW